MYINKMQALSTPKLYDDRLRNFLIMAREQFGVFDVNAINDVRQEALNRAFAERRPNDAVPLLPRVVAPNLNSTYLVDQLSLVNGFEIINAPLGNTAITTPLMVIYAELIDMTDLAVPPPETSEHLKYKYLIKLARRRTRAHVGRNNVRDYLELDIIDNVLNDDSSDAPWRNKQYLGATQEMYDAFGQELFDETRARDERRGARDFVEKPLTTLNYFSYGQLQVFMHLLSVDNDRGKEILGQYGQQYVSYLEQGTPENTRLREQLVREVIFLKAYLTYLNILRNPDRRPREIDDYLHDRIVVPPVQNPPSAGKYTKSAFKRR